MTTDSGAPPTSPWDRLAGQERAVAQLRRAAARPVHAYLLVGARGSGVEDAARCFAAALVAPEDDARAVDLALRGMHPDIVEFEPEGANYRVKEDVRERIIPEASRSPIEGARKVIVIFEAERLVFARRTESANALLKTIEEPPERTVMLLVTATPDELPDTVRSRCQRIDLVPLSDATLRAALEREGIAALESVYRDALAGDGAPRRNLDRAPLTVAPSTAATALAACASARESLERNPNESLLVERLLVSLPAAKSS